MSTIKSKDKDRLARIMIIVQQGIYLTLIFASIIGPIFQFAIITAGTMIPAFLTVGIIALYTQDQYNGVIEILQSDFPIGFPQLC